MLAHSDNTLAISTWYARGEALQPTTYAGAVAMVKG